MCTRGTVYIEDLIAEMILLVTPIIVRAESSEPPRAPPRSTACRVPPWLIHSGCAPQLKPVAKFLPRAHRYSLDMTDYSAGAEGPEASDLEAALDEVGSNALDGADNEVSAETGDHIAKANAAYLPLESNAKAVQSRPLQKSSVDVRRREGIQEPAQKASSLEEDSSVSSAAASAPAHAIAPATTSTTAHTTTSKTELATEVATTSPTYTPPQGKLGTPPPPPLPRSAPPQLSFDSKSTDDNRASVPGTGYASAPSDPSRHGFRRKRRSKRQSAVISFELLDGLKASGLVDETEYAKLKSRIMENSDDVYQDLLVMADKSTVSPAYEEHLSSAESSSDLELISSAAEPASLSNAQLIKEEANMRSHDSGHEIQ